MSPISSLPPLTDYDLTTTHCLELHHFEVFCKSVVINRGNTMLRKADKITQNSALQGICAKQ